MSIKIAIIGAGGMAAYHATGFRNAGADIVALCDVNEAEPTGNLDGDTAHAMVDLIFGINRERGTTLVLVTHDLELARKCQRVIRLARRECGE
jgi:Predicted ABC-type transport system involved in lysophospholipase L1 biosynthesis, ATPase component